MNYIYTKYLYSNKLRLLRMLAIIVVAVALFIVGVNKMSVVPSVMAWIVVIIGAVLVVAIGFLEIYRQSDISKLYPIVAIVLGVFFIFLIPAYETPDEQDHFGSAYNLSNTWLGVENPDETHRYMRQADAAIADADTLHNISEADYNKVLGNLGVVTDSQASEVVAVNYSANAGVVVYTLPALGITIARLLHLGFGWAYALGVFFNLLLYVLLTTYAIRIIPVGKRILFVVSLLPVMLQQVSSFSYDCALTACIMAILAISFTWRKEFKPTVLQIVIIVFSAIVFAGVKSGAFLVVLLLLPALCIRKSWFEGCAKKWTIGAILLIVIAIAVYVIFLGGYDKIVTFLVAVPNNVREIPGQLGVAPIEYLTNPGRFFGIIWSTFKENVGHYIAQIGGTALGYNRIFISKMIYIVNLLILFVSMIRYNKETDVYHVGNRILTFIIGIIPVLITVLAMLLYWTLPTDGTIMGLQGRYVLPTLAVLMLSVGRWQKIKIPDIDNLFAIGMTITGYVACISIL